MSIAQQLPNHDQIMKSIQYTPHDIAKGYGDSFVQAGVGSNHNLKDVFRRQAEYYNNMRIKYAKYGPDFWKSKVTIYDMMRINYPFMYDDNVVAAIQKADAPLLSSTTGAYVATHGLNAYHQIIQEANVYSILPKTPYLQGGYRAITAAGASDGNVGIPENNVVPDTLKPTLQNVNIGIKENAHSFNISSRQQFLSTINDNVWSEGGSGLDALRTYSLIEFNKRMNRQLLIDNDTLAGNNIESIDRVVGSYSEITGVGQTANDLDIYGIDRDAGASWVDAYVNHKSGVHRDLTLSLIKDVLTTVRPNWGGPGTGQSWQSLENKIWLTGFDTLDRIEQIFESQNHYVNGGARVDVTLNGVKTLPAGSAAGFLVSTLYKIPVMVSNDVPKDTLSRLYLLDLNNLSISQGVTTQYFEGGFSSGSVIELDQFQDKGVYYNMGELKATRFNVHGKLRDLQ